MEKEEEKSESFPKPLHPSQCIRPGQATTRCRGTPPSQDCLPQGGQTPPPALCTRFQMLAAQKPATGECLPSSPLKRLLFTQHLTCACPQTPVLNHGFWGSSPCQHSPNLGFSVPRVSALSPAESETSAMPFSRVGAPLSQPHQPPRHRDPGPQGWSFQGSLGKA